MNPSVESANPTVPSADPTVGSAGNPTVAAINPTVRSEVRRGDFVPINTGLKRIRNRAAHGNKPRPQIEVEDLWKPVETKVNHTLAAAFKYWDTLFPAGLHDPSMRQRIDFWLNHLGPDTQLSVITEVQVRRLADALRVSNATRNRYVAALGSLYKHAREKNGPLALAYIGSSPTRGVHYDEEAGKKRKTALTQAEINGLLAASLRSSWDRMRLFILIAMTTGMRRSNILWLRWHNIDMETGIVSAGAKPGREFDPTKARTQFATALDAEVAREAARFVGHPNDLVFPNSTDGETPRCIDTLFKQAVKLAGLRSSISPHWLRHTAATIFSRNGATQAKLMRLMNWKSEQMTRTYVHLNVEDIRADVGEIGKRMR